MLSYIFSAVDVVPLVGTWIETCSLVQQVRYAAVVPLVGTWIETIPSILSTYHIHRRSPRGNVD